MWLFSRPCLHTQNSFRNLIKTNQNQIVFTIFPVWFGTANGQCPFAVPNPSEKGKYNRISVWLNKISNKKSVCTYTRCKFISTNGRRINVKQIHTSLKVRFYFIFILEPNGISFGYSVITNFLLLWNETKYHKIPKLNEKYEHDHNSFSLKKNVNLFLTMANSCIFHA